MSRKSVAWLPAIVVPALIAVGVVAVPLQAGAAVDLPDKTADEVLRLIADSAEDSFSGTVLKTADLGLPVGLDAALPGGMAEAGGLGWVLELLSGSQEARVFADGPLNLRVQIQDRLAERNIVSNGTDAWYYDSETNVATHVPIPADLATRLTEQMDASAELATPAQIADRILDELGPSTQFSVGTDARVAGRTVYELVMTPRASGTLAESVSISVDSETGLPLAVSIAATGQEEPAFEVGFTAIDLSDPAAELFTFIPGDGVVVEEHTLPAHPGDGDHARRTDRPTVSGSGWDAIVELPAGSIPGGEGDLLLSELTTPVDGGRLFSTALVTVLLTDDGRVLAGSVPVHRLQAAADAT